MWIETTEIDGLILIQGFNGPNIDPVATKRAVNQVVSELPETLEIKSLGDKYQDILRERTYSKSNRWNKLTARLERIRFKAEQLANRVQDSLPRIREQNAIPLRGDSFVEVDEKTFTNLKNAASKLRAGQWLTLTGEVVEDHRGKELFYLDGRWKKFFPKHLGERIPEGARVYDDLTKEEKAEISVQDQKDHFASLPDAERKSQLDRALYKASLRAVDVEKAYRIQDRDDPEGGAKAWYEHEKTRLEDLYGGTG